MQGNADGLNPGFTSGKDASHRLGEIHIRETEPVKQVERRGHYQDGQQATDESQCENREDLFHMPISFAPEEVAPPVNEAPASGKPWLLEMVVEGGV